MSENTEATATPNESTKHQDGGGFKAPSEAKATLIKMLFEGVDKPKIKDASSPEGVAFAVCLPGDEGRVLCYCTCREDAELIASSVHMATKMAIAHTIL